MCQEAAGPVNHSDSTRACGSFEFALAVLEKLSDGRPRPKMAAFEWKGGMFPFSPLHCARCSALGLQKEETLHFSPPFQSDSEKNRISTL